MIETIVSILVLLISLGSMLSIVWFTVQTGISPMPSNHEASFSALSLMPDEHVGVLYDLGSGWGQVAALFAQQYPQFQVVGVELSWIPYWFSRLRYRSPNLRFIRQDFRTTKPPDHSVLYCYLYPEGMQTIAQLEAFSNCWILSNTFACPNRQLTHESIVSDIHGSPVRLYAPKNSLSPSRAE